MTPTTALDTQSDELGRRRRLLVLAICCAAVMVVMLDISIAGTIVGSSLADGGAAYTTAEQGVWWMILALGAGIMVLGFVCNGRWARSTAERAATLFDEVDRGADTRPAAARS
ncbi:hypothetical protein [Dactylosporangium sp. NPDC051484]|uniref:hypothetical protein n=1 Tax=Dactylosporangium sp. NPDC051484 TaxID=3154942 RepID=UPI00344F4AF4